MNVGYCLPNEDTYVYAYAHACRYKMHACNYLSSKINLNEN